MHKRIIKSIFSFVGHELELCAVFAVVTFLLVLKVTHVVEPEVISSAILIVLVLLTIASLRDRSNDRELRRQLAEIRKLINTGDQGVRWYEQRDHGAKAEMLIDLQAHEHIVFIGVTQSTLFEYVSEVLESEGPPLPWKKLEIYYASPAIGTIHDPIEFKKKVADSRHRVAQLLTSAKSSQRAPRLATVQFNQYERLINYGGSIFYSSSEDDSIIYIVHSRIAPADLKQALTVRFEPLSPQNESPIHRARRKHYLDGYNDIKENSLSLGCFERAVWEISAERWAKYALNSPSLRSSMQNLIDFAQIDTNEHVLELGCGSGETSKLLVNHLTDGEIVLLDASPQMIHSCRRHFGNEEKVHLALCSLPLRDKEGIDLDGRRFSTIIAHQSLQEILSRNGGIEPFANWCFDILKERGRVIVAAHNTVVETNRPPGYEQWDDEFQKILIEEINRNLYCRNHIRQANSVKLYTEKALVDGFNAAGFELLKTTRKTFPYKMAERIEMWRVPAIMDSVLDVMSLEIGRIDEVMNRVSDRTKDRETMPRTVSYWIFGRSSN